MPYERRKFSQRTRKQLGLAPYQRKLSHKACIKDDGKKAPRSYFSQESSGEYADCRQFINSAVGSEEEKGKRSPIYRARLTSVWSYCLGDRSKYLTLQVRYLHVLRRVLVHCRPSNATPCHDSAALTLRTTGTTRLQQPACTLPTQHSICLSYLFFIFSLTSAAPLHKAFWLLPKIDSLFFPRFFPIFIHHSI